MIMDILSSHKGPRVREMIEAVDLYAAQECANYFTATDTMQ